MPTPPTTRPSASLLVLRDTTSGPHQSPGCRRSHASPSSRSLTVWLLLGALVIAAPLLHADWPAWRYDAGRSGSSPEALPSERRVLWKRALPPSDPAYRNPRLRFDAGPEPILVNGRVVVPSSSRDRVTAYSADTGTEQWRAYADGPIRFAPAAWRSTVIFGSDDGVLRSVEAASGALRWKLRVVPSRRRVLGNRRLISMWPVRGGPVVSQDTVYFAAGVWSFEGTFVAAADAESGELRWVNDRSGFVYGQHPHGAEAFGGLSPQGYLVARESAHELIVPCGTAYPGTFDLRDGRLIYFQLPKQSRYPGGWFAFLGEDKARAIRHGKVEFDTQVNRELHEDNPRHGDGVAGASRRVTFGGRNARVRRTDSRRRGSHPLGHRRCEAPHRRDRG